MRACTGARHPRCWFLPRIRCLRLHGKIFRLGARKQGGEWKAALELRGLEWHGLFHADWGRALAKPAVDRGTSLLPSMSRSGGLVCQRRRAGQWPPAANEGAGTEDVVGKESSLQCQWVPSASRQLGACIGQIADPAASRVCLPGRCPPRGASAKALYALCAACGWDVCQRSCSMSRSGSALPRIARSAWCWGSEQVLSSSSGKDAATRKRYASPVAKAHSQLALGPSPEALLRRR